MNIKNLNPMIAAQLKLILKRNDIRVELKREPGVDTYTVIDPMGQTVASIEWFENANKTTPEQKAVFDIFDIISKKYEEQEKTKRLMANMSEEDKALLNMLQQHTNEPEKQK